MFLKQKLRIFIFLAVAFFAFFLQNCSNDNFIGYLRLKSYDVLLRFRYDHTPKPQEINRIIIIGLDEETFIKLKERVPFNRGFLGLILKKMDSDLARPRVAGFDFIFTGNSDKKESDLFFDDALSLGNNVLASYFDSKGQLILPEREFISSARGVGFIDLPMDIDNVGRRFLPYLKLSNNTIDYHLALWMFALDNGKNIEKSVIDLKNGTITIPSLGPLEKSISLPVDVATSSSRINYLAKAEDFKVIPLWKVLNPHFDMSIFKNKIVLFGSTSEIEHDIFPTPFGNMPGAVINANIILSLNSHRLLHELPLPLALGILILTGFIVCLIIYPLNSYKALLIVAVVIFMGFNMSLFFIVHDLIFDFADFFMVVIVAYLLTDISKYILINIESNQLRQLAMTDALTGLYAYRYFELRLNIELKAVEDGSQSLALLMFDIDNFKQLNDTYGHEAGNKALKNIASIMTSSSRHTDIVARFGGEEFVVILPKIDQPTALKIADKIRKAVEDYSFIWQDHTLKITVSVGVVSLEANNIISSEKFIDNADKALYRAKSAGKNRVCE